MKKISIVSVLIITTVLSSCIGDDLVKDSIEPEVRILNAVDSIKINSQYNFMAGAFDATGTRIDQPMLNWTSSDTSVLSINVQTGIASAKKLGTTLVEVSTHIDGTVYTDENIVSVGNTTVSQTTERSGSLQTTSSYTLTGDFVLRDENGTLKLFLAENYRASSSLPGLYVYLTNNPATSVGALEIGPAKSFNGAHTYTIPSGTGINDFQYVLYFCKPFNVKVGDGLLSN